MGFLTAVWGWLRQLVGLILPIFSKARDFPGLGKAVRWALHLLLLAGILVLLWFINGYIHWERLIGSSNRFLRGYWLPLLFLLLYVLSWLGYVLWQLLLPEEMTSDFPEIDEAWAEAVAALSHNGISVQDLPLFLIVGRNAAGVEYFFKGSQLALIVSQVPPRADAALHVYVDAEGIYVSCTDSSLLSRHAALLAGEPGQRRGSFATLPENPEFDPLATARPGGLVEEIRKILKHAEEQGRGPEQLTDEERRQIRLLQHVDHIDAAGKPVEPRPALLKNTAEVELYSARFRHVCQLISQDRRPFCPINGMLILLPLASMDTDEVAEHTASLCQKDMLVARQTLRMYWPTLSLVCDLERLPGFREMLAGLPGTELRKRRMGQRFQLFPALDVRQIPEKVESLAEWVCQGALGHWVFNLFQVESVKKSLAEVVTLNGQLYRFYYQLRERRKRLGRILAHGVITADTDLPLFAGCYLAATGRDLDTEQAFLPGVLRRMVDRNEKPTFQNSVAWTADAKKENSDFLTWTRYGYIILILVVLAGVGLLVWTLRR